MASKKAKWSEGTVATMTGAMGALPTFTIKSMIYADASGALTSTANPTNGQILIGDTGNIPQLGTIGSGTGVTVTNGTHSISISIGQAVATSSDVTFNTVISSNAFTANNGGKKILLEGLPGSESGYGGIWIGQASPSAANYGLLSDGTDLLVNAPSGGTIRLRNSNADVLYLDSGLHFSGKTGSFYGVGVNGDLAAAPLAELEGICDGILATPLTGDLPGFKSRFIAKRDELTALSFGNSVDREREELMAICEAGIASIDKILAEV